MSEAAPDIDFPSFFLLQCSDCAARVADALAAIARFTSSYKLVPTVPTVPRYRTCYDMATYPGIYVYDAPGINPSALWQLWSWNLYS